MSQPTSQPQPQPQPTSVPVPQIHGHCDDRFTAVRTRVEENFRERGELGAAVTVRAGGETVVDLWGGWADAAHSRPWDRDTVVNVWSTTKGPTALCAHLLADRGLLDLDAPVASYWPEFAAAGKQDVPVRHLLSHRAGLAGLREPHTLSELYDWELTCARLAATEPWWEPGTRSGYHAITYGFLVGEVIRRVTGLLPGKFLHREVTGPLGIDFTVGLPEKESGRAAELVHARTGPTEEQAALFGRPGAGRPGALLNPGTGAAQANTPEWRPPRSPPPTPRHGPRPWPPCTGYSPNAAAAASTACCPPRPPNGPAKGRAAAGTWCSVRVSAAKRRPAWACG